MSKLTLEVACGDGAFMSIADPRSFKDGGVEWRLRYGNTEKVRYIAAALVESYDYLLSGEITQKEAERRLRLLRQARRAALSAAEATSAPTPAPVSRKREELAKAVENTAADLDSLSFDFDGDSSQMDAITEAADHLRNYATALRTPHVAPGEVLAKFARIGRDMEMRLLTQKSDVPGLSPQDYTEVTTELGHAADAVLRAELNERAPGTLPPLKEGERRIEELWALDALTIQDWIDLYRLTASREDV